jgi:hypothetical protein
LWIVRLIGLFVGVGTVPRGGCAVYVCASLTLLLEGATENKYYHVSHLFFKFRISKGEDRHVNDYVDVSAPPDCFSPCFARISVLFEHSEYINAPLLGREKQEQKICR